MHGMHHFWTSFTYSIHFWLQLTVEIYSTQISLSLVAGQHSQCSWGHGDWWKSPRTRSNVVAVTDGQSSTCVTWSLVMSIRVRLCDTVSSLVISSFTTAVYVQLCCSFACLQGSGLYAYLRMPSVQPKHRVRCGAKWDPTVGDPSTASSIVTCLMSPDRVVMSC